MRADQELTYLDGSVETVVFHNESTGFVVLELNTGDEIETVVGELGNIEAGEELHLTGSYVNHAKFGSQFKASVCERSLPVTSNAIRKYLSSGVVKGIGPKIAERIVEMFGDETLEIIEKTPEKLSLVRGISEDSAREYAKEFKRIFGVRSVMVFLSKYGVSPIVSLNAWKMWGDKTLEVIEENPYALCRDNIELGFLEADTIAQKMSLSEVSSYRIKAGITYVLSENSNNGHTCLPLKGLRKVTCSLLKINRETFDDILESELEEDNLVKDKRDGQDFIYLADMYTAEDYISARLNMLRTSIPFNQQDYEGEIKAEEAMSSIAYEDLQRKAIAMALSQGLLILTGGPGTGKTTTLNAIISIFKQQGKKVMITAPTGRAAKRISELTGFEAKTIHRLLEYGYYNGSKLRFMRNEENPLHCEVMIIDEMSMVDTLLFEALLRALKNNCRLIMVGDSDQLPSVGSGNILKDMIDSDVMTVVELKEIFRQAQRSLIVTNAHSIVRGELPVLDSKDRDFFFMTRLRENDACNTVVELCTKRLPKAYGLSPINGIQVLSPSRKGELGTIILNKKLQQVLNPPDGNKQETTHGDYIFREGDKIMQIKNNYDIVWSKDGESGTGVFNGDIGCIQMVDRPSQTVIIDFEGREAEYNFDMLNEIELAYAITVHKSQGSEFEAVVMPILGGFDKLYYRNLLYTAITRAKQMIVIVGSPQLIEKMVANDKKTLRYTGLSSMLRRQAFNEQ